MIIAASILLLIVCVALGWWLSGKILNDEPNEIRMPESEPEDDILDSIRWDWHSYRPFDYEKVGF